MSTIRQGRRSEILGNAAKAYESAADYVDPESQYDGGGIPMLRFRVFKDTLEEELCPYFEDHYEAEDLLEPPTIEALRHSASGYGQLICELHFGEVDPPEADRKEKAEEIRQISEILEKRASLAERNGAAQLPVLE